MTNSFADECIAKLLGPNPLAAKSVLVALRRRYRVIKDTGKTDSPSAELAGAKVCWHKATGETKVIDLSSAGLTLPHFEMLDIETTISIHPERRTTTLPIQNEGRRQCDNRNVAEASLTCRNPSSLFGEFYARLLQRKNSSLHNISRIYDVPTCFLQLEIFSQQE